MRRVKFNNSAFINTKLLKALPMQILFDFMVFNIAMISVEDNKLIIGISGAGGTNIKGKDVMCCGHWFLHQILKQILTLFLYLKNEKSYLFPHLSMQGLCFSKHENG